MYVCMYIIMYVCMCVCMYTMYVLFNLFIPAPVCPDGENRCNGVCIPDKDKDCIPDERVIFFMILY